MRIKALTTTLLVVLFGLSLATASERAEPPNPKWIWHNPAALVDALAGDERVYLAGADTVSALDRQTGRRLWQTEVPGVTGLCRGDGTLTAFGDKIVQLESRSGEIVTETTSPEPNLTPTPEVVSGRILAESAERVYLFDAASLATTNQIEARLFPQKPVLLRHTELWRHRFSPDQSRVYFVSEDKLIGIDLATDRVILEKQTDYPIIDWPTVMADRAIVQAKHHLLSFDLDSGKVKWKTRLRSHDAPLPVVITDRTVTNEPWYERLYNRIRGIVNDKRSSLIVEDSRGLIWHRSESGKHRLTHMMPGRVIPIANNGRSSYWIFNYTDDADGQRKSVAMRLTNQTMELVGRDAIAGDFGGLFNFGKKHLYAELGFGKVAEISKGSMTVRQVFAISETPLIMLSAEDNLVAAGADGVVMCFDAR